MRTQDQLETLQTYGLKPDATDDEIKTRLKDLSALEREAVLRAFFGRRGVRQTTDPDYVHIQKQAPPLGELSEGAKAGLSAYQKGGAS